MNVGSPEIRGACYTRAPYFRYLFANSEFLNRKTAEVFASAAANMS